MSHDRGNIPGQWPAGSEARDEKDWQENGPFANAHDHHAANQRRLQNVATPSVLQQGAKLDQGKLMYHLLPPDALEGVVKVLTVGATKYAPRNWEKGILYSRVFAALMRHLWAWWNGEENDEETGHSHLDHAHCCILFLSSYTKRRMTDFDDRPHIENRPNSPSQVP